jgi:hypothetical protein
MTITSIPGALILAFYKAGSLLGSEQRSFSAAAHLSNSPPLRYSMNKSPEDAIRGIQRRTEFLQ